METAQEHGQEHGDRRRKKKKSFLQRAKKFGKSGRFGQGREIDRDTYDYFVRVMENMRSPEAFEDEEAEAMFVSNVFVQTEGEETKLCGNQLVSRVIEQLLPKADDAVRGRFRDVLAEDLRITCTDAFASHVLEKLIHLSSSTSSSSPSSKTWLLRVAKFAVNNMEEFMFDTYASHILRTVFQCLAGMQVSGDMLKSKRARDAAAAAATAETGQAQGGRKTAVAGAGEETVATDPDFVQVLEEACSRILTLEGKKDIVQTDISAGVLQVLMVVLEKVLPKHFRKLSRRFIDEAFPKTFDLSFFECEPFCRTLEVIISCAKTAPKIYRKVQDLYFKTHIADLAQHSTANFAVQKMLASCTDKAEFDSIYEMELDEHIEDIFAAGNTGVILAVAQACRRISTKQAHFFVALMKSFHCYEPQSQQDKIVPLLVRMTTRESVEGLANEADVPSIHIHGSLILQELLNFSKPIKVVSSLLGMEAASLRQLLSDPRGSHITDAFMGSEFIGEKSRDGLVKSLRGELVALACTKHGSRSLDAIWKNSSHKSREIMASELAPMETVLNSNPFGKFISSNCSLSTFKRAREEWKSALNLDKKKRGLFSDILSEMPAPKKLKPTEVEEATSSVGVLPKTDENSPRKKKQKAKSYLDDL